MTLEQRVAALERLAVDPTPVVHMVLQKWGIPTFPNGGQRKALEDMVAEQVAKEVLRQRRHRQERWTDHWIWRTTQIGTPVISAVAVIVTILLHRG